jgi:hypothetical protein
MSPLTREQKLASFKELTKRPGIKTGSEFEYSRNIARLLIDHPHAYRDWTVVGPDSVPGFWPHCPGRSGLLRRADDLHAVRALPLRD